MTAPQLLRFLTRQTDTVARFKSKASSPRITWLKTRLLWRKKKQKTMHQKRP